MNDGLRLTVLGAGHLGITHAASMASLGFNVLGVDTDRGKVDQLNAGHLPIYEPDLEELLRAGLSAGREGTDVFGQASTAEPEPGEQ